MSRPYATGIPVFDANPDRRFGGVRRAYGTSALRAFELAHICVIGLGGVGSWAAEALARSAIGRLTLIDMDHIAESNINRQVHALSTSLGQAKVEAMQDRIAAINPDCKVRCIDEFVTIDNMQTMLLEGYDYIIDCVDNFRTKAAIIHFCKRKKIKLVTVGGAGGLIDPVQVKVADLTRSIHDPLFARTRKLLRLRYGFSANPRRRFDIPCVFSTEQPVYPDGHGEVCLQKPQAVQLAGLSCASGIGSAVTVTASFGLIATAHVLRKLAERLPTA